MTPEGANFEDTVAFGEAALLGREAGLPENYVTQNEEDDQSEKSD